MYYDKVFTAIVWREVRISYLCKWNIPVIFRRLLNETVGVWPQFDLFLEDHHVEFVWTCWEPRKKTMIHDNVHH